MKATKNAKTKILPREILQTIDSVVDTSIKTWEQKGSYQAQMMVWRARITSILSDPEISEDAARALLGTPPTNPGGRITTGTENRHYRDAADLLFPKVPQHCSDLKRAPLHEMLITMKTALHKNVPFEYIREKMCF